MKWWMRLTLLLVLSSAANVSMAAKKTIGILVFDGVLSSDVTAPLEVFGVATRKSWFDQYEAVTIGVDANRKQVVTEEGIKLGVDYWYGDAPKLDVLLVASSYDMTPFLKNKGLVEFIRQSGKRAEWLASNCSGAFLLAEAGLLDGKKATTWFGGEGELQSAYPNVNVVKDQNVVVDGNIITSNGSLISYQSALTLLSRMASKRKADEVAEAIQYARFSQQAYQ